MMAPHIDGQQPLSAYREPVDIFVKVGHLMILIAPAPYLGVPIHIAQPGEWGLVYEPIDDKFPGTKPHVLKVSKYMFQEVIFVRNLFTNTPHASPWMTDKELRLDWDALMSYRHAVVHPEDLYDVVSVMNVVPEDNLRRGRQDGVPEQLVILSSYLLIRMSELRGQLMALVPQPSPRTEIATRPEPDREADEESEQTSSGRSFTSSDNLFAPTGNIFAPRALLAPDVEIAGVSPEATIPTGFYGESIGFVSFQGTGHRLDDDPTPIATDAPTTVAVGAASTETSTSFHLTEPNCIPPPRWAPHPNSAHGPVGG